MSVFDDIIERNGRIIGKNWIEWKLSQSGLHCLMCMVLDGCWFNKSLMPALPLHDKCHCISSAIPTPNQDAVSANCPIEKFTGYIFSDDWNIKTGKKDLFEYLGFTIKDSEMLKKEFEKQARKCYANGEYKLGLLNFYGQRISIEIVIERENSEPARFMSGWMVKPNGKITLNTPLGG